MCYHDEVWGLALLDGNFAGSKYLLDHCHGRKESDNNLGRDANTGRG